MKFKNVDDVLSGFAQYVVDSSKNNLTPFHDRFENQLAGWSATMDILIYNDIYIC